MITNTPFESLNFLMSIRECKYIPFNFANKWSSICKSKNLKIKQVHSGGNSPVLALKKEKVEFSFWVHVS